MELVKVRLVIKMPNGSVVESTKTLLRDDIEWVVRQYHEVNNAGVSAYKGDALLYQLPNNLEGTIQCTMAF